MTQDFEQVFSDAVARLRRHFGDVCVRKPKPKSQVTEKFANLPHAPEEIVRFYNLCDGVDVGIDVEGDLYDLGRLAEYHSFLPDIPNCKCLLPIRADGCGDHDCVVTGSSGCAGAVVFWDHEVWEGPAYLLGGSLSGYLTMWVDHLVTEYAHDGTRLPEAIPPKLDTWPFIGKAQLVHPWPFDEEWMRHRDQRADAILSDPSLRSWLLRQDKL